MNGIRSQQLFSQRTPRKIKYQTKILYSLDNFSEGGVRDGALPLQINHAFMNMAIVLKCLKMYTNNEKGHKTFFDDVERPFAVVIRMFVHVKVHRHIVQFRSMYRMGKMEKFHG